MNIVKIMFPLCPRGWRYNIDWSFRLVRQASATKGVNLRLSACGIVQCGMALSMWHGIATSSIFFELDFFTYNFTLVENYHMGVNVLTVQSLILMSYFLFF